MSTSLWQTPQACTLIRTCPAPGIGISRSTIWKSAPGLDTCATFIVATATVVVAINPLTNFQTLLKSTYCRYPFIFLSSGVARKNKVFCPHTSTWPCKQIFFPNERSLPKGLNVSYAAS